MGAACCKSKKASEIEKQKKVLEERDTDTPQTPTTPGVISMDEQSDNLEYLFDSLDTQFRWYLDKEFPFPTSRADLIESPDKPILKFSIFIEFYRSAMVWNKILIQKKKYDNTNARRKLFKANEMQAYMQECLKYAAQDEQCL